VPAGCREGVHGRQLADMLTPKLDGNVEGLDHIRPSAPSEAHPPLGTHSHTTEREQSRAAPAQRSSAVLPGNASLARASPRLGAEPSSRGGLSGQSERAAQEPGASGGRPSWAGGAVRSSSRLQPPENSALGSSMLRASAEAPAPTTAHGAFQVRLPNCYWLPTLQRQLGFLHAAAAGE
jgi:hypothetical protein